MLDRSRPGLRASTAAARAFQVLDLRAQPVSATLPAHREQPRAAAMATPAPAAGDGCASAMRYPGGKNQGGVFQNIINEIPPHEIYLECFLGSGAIMRHKRPAAQSIGVDLDPRALDLCRGAVPHLKLVRADALSYVAGLTWTKESARRTVIYFDPPYLASTRSSGAIYRHEFMTEPEHRRLLKLCKRLPCYVLLSGYDSELYRRELAAWRRVEIPTVNRAGKRCMEILWMNYPAPFELHDYQFLGRNKAQRQNIKRQLATWRRRLLEMPPARRACLLQAIDGLRSEAAADDCGSHPATQPRAAALDQLVAQPVSTPRDHEIGTTPNCGRTRKGEILKK